MNSERDRRVEELFEQLADEPRSTQMPLLEVACGGDRELVAEVAALLEADADGHPILHHDAARLASDLLDTASPPVLSGRVGRYVIEKYLGEGGMGSVYVARRDDLGDRVALKFLHDLWSSPGGRRRFAKEQMMLASLNHRSIARLYDAGVTNGQPWFAMEYVQGLSIAEHCRRNGVGLVERLRLFRTACEAVSYAHRNLTVHLDLKPSNVLVSAEGDVKLLDFGIARHLAREGTAETTATVHRLLSLNFASPEQILGHPLDVQADVYALGVLLYLLLVGAPPVDLTDVSAAELARALEHEPRTPSAAARAGRTDAIQASRAQWSDLDLLCVKAMRRDKTERYQTVDRLMTDIDHFLADEPIEARTDSFRYYRLRKFLSRHRQSVAAAAAVVVTISALIVFFNVRLIDARDRALSSEARMQRVYRLMLNLFEGDDSTAGPAEDLRVVNLLDRGVREAESLRHEPDLQAELNFTFGGLYHKLGHLDRAQPLLVSALAAERSFFGRDAPQTLRSQLALAMLRIDQSKTDEAEQLARESLELAKRHYPPDSIEVATPTAVLGKVRVAQGDYLTAVPLLEQAVKRLSKAPGSVELSEALGDLANAHYYLGHIEASESINRRSLSLDQELFGERHPSVAIDLYNLGNIQLDRGDYRQGERLFRQALEINEGWYGPHHARTASSLLMVGRSESYLGHLSEAAGLYQRALSAMRAVYGDKHPRYATVLSLMGDLARDRGELDEAERLFQGAGGIFKDVNGEQHEFYLHQLSNLGSVYLARGRYAAAEGVLRTAVERLTAVVPDTRYSGLAQIRLGAALAGRRQYAEAERHALAGYLVLRKVTSASAAELQAARKELAGIYEALNQPARANELTAEFARQGVPLTSQTAH